jgi:hypothetical protein
MIQSTLLAALGFLTACLLFLFVAPAFWARAVRLTTQKLRNSLPVSESEVRASQDLIRAQYAVKVHQLSKSIDQSRLAAHRQTIEINRRDANITKLRANIVQLSLDLAEHQNAHGVLKQTINDRLPKLEGGIEDARRLLESRDGEIRALGDDADRQQEALNEARQIHAQQANEIERLRLALATAQGQDRRRAMDLGGDTEFSLRSELDRLRITARSQATMINRLQSELGAGQFGSGMPDLAVDRSDGAIADNREAFALEGSGVSDDVSAAADADNLRSRVAEQAAEIRQLRRDLVQAQEASQVDSDQMVLLQQIRGLEAKTLNQSDEIRRLRDEVDRLTATVTPDTAKVVAESKSFLKSRLEKLETVSRSEREVAGRLRAELASANERAARQALYFRDELRRLGTRSLAPVTSGSKTSRGNAVSTSPPVVELASVNEAPVAVDRRAIWAARFLPAPSPPRAVLNTRDRVAETVAVASPAAEVPLDTLSVATTDDGVPAPIMVTETPLVANTDDSSHPARMSEFGSGDADGAHADAGLSDVPVTEKRGRLLDRLRSYDDAS